MPGTAEAMLLTKPGVTVHPVVTEAHWKRMVLISMIIQAQAVTGLFGMAATGIM
jgi:hypothetical protein